MSARSAAADGRRPSGDSSHRAGSQADSLAPVARDHAAQGRGEWFWPVAFVALVALAGCVEIEDDDIWWHLRTGQLIIERGQVPRTDWFTYTNPTSAWIDLHWSFQVAAAGLWAAGGTAALVLVKSVLGAATFAILLAVRRPNWPHWHSVACLIAPLLAFIGRNQVRPEAVSFLLLAGVLWILFHVRKRPGLVWLLPLLMLLWVNSHGLFVLGLVVWGCFLADAALRQRWAAGRPESERGPTAWRRWALATGLMAVAVLANPYGYRGALFPITLLARIQGSQREFYQQFAGEFSGLGEFIREYGPLALLTNLTTLMLLVTYLLGVASFILLLWRGRFSIYRAMLFAMFGYLAWQASRNSALFAVVGGLVLRANFGDFFDRAPAVKATAARSLHVGRALVAACLVLLLLAVPSGALSLVSGSASGQRRFGLGEVPGWFAHEAARFLGRDGMPRNVYALDQGPAAVYIFHNGPQRRVFADGRLEVNTPETLDRYLQIAAQLAARDPHVIENLSRGLEPGPDGRPEAPALLLDLRTPVWFEGVAQDPRFRPVFCDQSAIVFLTAERADRLGLPSVPVAPLIEAARAQARPVKSKGQ